MGKRKKSSKKSDQPQPVKTMRFGKRRTIGRIPWPCSRNLTRDAYGTLAKAHASRINRSFCGMFQITACFDTGRHFQ